MEQILIKKISRGTRFNQVYLKKNEGLWFEPGRSVIISPLEGSIPADTQIFEYNTSLDSIKKEIARKIFRIIGSICSYSNILITGSFLETGFGFDDVDIIILDPGPVQEDRLKSMIGEIGIKPHLMMMGRKSLDKGISRDPLFRMMAARYVSVRRILLKKEKSVDYRLLDIHLAKNRNLIDGYGLLSIGQRKKLLRDFISIKLFAENKEVTTKDIEKEAERLFGKQIIERLFYYADDEAKKKFLSVLKKEFNKLEGVLIGNAAKQA